MPSTIRNVTIVAHIDHGKFCLGFIKVGKTTLADSLLAANNFLSQRMAGSAKLMDYLPEEAARGITMKASSAALTFRFPNDLKLQFNLIDSPGHVDFAYEVASAFSLSDGAILLIDVVEGICPQTAVLLKMAMKLRIRPILVLNKIDRLFHELKFTPDQAYHHLFASVTSANALFATIAHELGSSLAPDILDADNFFSPEKGNVIFSSAFDGWGFQLAQFAHLYASKLNLAPAQLTQFLWGFHYYDPKTKTIIDQKQLGDRKLKPLFVQLILSNIWDVYQAVMEDRDIEKIQKIVTLLKVQVLPRELKSKETRNTLKTILSQWLPLASTVVTVVKNHLPSPSEAQRYRLEASIPHLLPGRDFILNCDASPKAPTVAFVSKMFPILAKDLPTNKRNFSIPKPRVKKDISPEEALPLTDLKLTTEPAVESTLEPKEVLIAFARIFSGSLKEGDTIHVLGPKFNPSEPQLYHTETSISSLYLMKGRDLEKVDQVCAGQVFAIMGLQDIVLKSATLTSNPLGPNLGSVILEPPIVRVAVEPQDASNMDKFLRGLEMLNQADPCVEIILQDSGEHVLCTAGELHLEVSFQG
jgi:ribosome assembly protein 1